MLSEGMPKELKDYVELEAVHNGFRIVDIILKGQNGTLLEILLDKDGGITMEDCCKFNSMVSLWLEQSNILGQNYTVDVCSPGIDRVLKKDNDFLWAMDKDIRVLLQSSVDGMWEITGKLLKSQDGSIDIELQNKNIINILRNNIVKAKLYLNFGADNKFHKKCN
ncbi:protein belonging to Uncharacterized protein family UPF0090 [Candidatus Omnitrophus magneticus]|uniref:Ribosome maturation factor RimP n=1 Tax=Candidatus Omnitrophus magneticus TaxID=1609969 RepID=A0A0F0CML2_9BACT|nr:protein belonging to Uncharacterized protein family UPF0090 [Candidatus Omnitrophus magneticus]